MKDVKAAVDRPLRVIESQAGEARRLRTSGIGADREDGFTHRVLVQLCEQGGAEQGKLTSQYRLTLKLSVLRQQYAHALGLPRPVRSVLDAVAAQCRQLVRLTVACGAAASNLGAVCRCQRFGAKVIEGACR